MRWRVYVRKLFGQKRRTARVVLVNRGKFLLVQEAVGYNRELWCLPGGGINKNETAEMAAIREVKEEVGFDVKLLKELIVTEDKKVSTIIHIFLGKITGGELKINPMEHIDAKWMTLDNIKKLDNKLRGSWVIEAVTLV